MKRSMMNVEKRWAKSIPIPPNTELKSISVKGKVMKIKIIQNSDTKYIFNHYKKGHFIFNYIKKFHRFKKWTLRMVSVFMSRGKLQKLTQILTLRFRIFLLGSYESKK